MEGESNTRPGFRCSQAKFATQNSSGDHALRPIILLAAGAALQVAFDSVRRNTRTPCASITTSGIEPQIVPSIVAPYATEAISARVAFAETEDEVAGAQTSKPVNDLVATSPCVAIFNISDFVRSTCAMEGVRSRTS